MATPAATVRGLGLRRPVAATTFGLGAVALVCLGLGLLSLLGPSTPTYDPWSWIIWGREILHLDLDTQYGPSWKPLPVLFTTPFALFPDASPDLWVAVARAGGLAAIAMSYRVAARLGGGVAGGLIAATSLALSTDFLRFAWVGDSEGLLVALLLAGVELHLAGRERAAIWAGFAVALLRPESWPFVGLYALWVAWRDPKQRRLVAGLCVAGFVLWFGAELWGSGNPLRAGERARNPNPNALAFADNPALEVVKRWFTMTPFPAELGLAITFVLAAVRRRLEPRVLMAIAAVVWLGVVAVMTEGGFSGHARYLIAPVALACVAGGAGLGEALNAGLRRPAIAALAAVALLSPVIATRIDDVRHDARAVRNEARLMDDLSLAVQLAGGAETVRRCGFIATGPFQVPALAWRLDLPIGGVGLKPRAPGSVFRAGGRPRPIPGAPPLAVPDRRVREVARGMSWQVMSTCHP